MSIAIVHFAVAQYSGDPEGRWFSYGARASAFAGAYATQIQDVSSMYWNPATIAYLDGNSVLWDYFQEWHGKMKSELLAMPFTVGMGNAVAFGINATQIQLSDEFGKHTGSMYGFDFASATELTSTFSLGIRGTAQYGTAGNEQLWTGSSAIGILYAPGPEVGYGMVLSGLGGEVQYSIDNGALVLKHQTTPRNLQLGLAMRFPSSKLERTVTISLANDKTFGTKGIRYNGAIEWLATRFLALRTGYVVSPTYAGAKYGIGIHTAGMLLDYAISPSTLTDQFQEITMSIQF
ncbi:MAG: hypothetical protein KGJ59_03520 [Bacteroidota bacterium]|nr:hypothetical protein [Bacteroidota bacterium]